MWHMSTDLMLFRRVSRAPERLWRAVSPQHCQHQHYAEHLCAFPHSRHVSSRCSVTCVTSTKVQILTLMRLLTRLSGGMLAVCSSQPPGPAHILRVGGAAAWQDDLGTQFTCFTGAKVQILTLKALLVLVMQGMTLNACCVSSRTTVEVAELPTADGAGRFRRPVHLVWASLCRQRLNRALIEP